MLYDCIVVLGSKPNQETWEFPSHVTASLDKAVVLLQHGAAPYVAVSGKWALSFDAKKIVQPEPEAAMMMDYLVKHGVRKDSILQEDESEDTISNIYFLKQMIFRPRKMKKVLFIEADFRANRIEYLLHKILGSSYKITIQTVESKSEEIYPHEAETFDRTRYYLDRMQPGDDVFLKGMFYAHPFYTAPWPLKKR